MFLTDRLLPLLEVAQSLTGRKYGGDEASDVSLRVLAEHGRATTFLIADGVLPSNEGRGYVLRRMLRRLVTHARKLGADHPVPAGWWRRPSRCSAGPTPSWSRWAFILQVAGSEEERFGATYRQGMGLLETEIERARPGTAAVRMLAAACGAGARHFRVPGAAYRGARRRRQACRWTPWSSVG